MNERKLGSSGYPYQFFMASSADHATGVTGLTPTAMLSKNGGAFATPAGAIVEVGLGWYALQPNATDRNLIGDCILHATSPGCDVYDGRFTIVPWDPFDPNLALMSLPAAAAGAVGGLPTVDANNAIKLPVGTGAGQINLAGGSVTISQPFPANFAGLVINASGGVTAGTVADKSGYFISPNGLDAVTIEAGVNARQAVSAILASAVGVLAGAATNTITIQGGNAATTRISATVDADGNRTAVSLNLPA